MTGIKDVGRSAGVWYLIVIVFGISAEVIRSTLVLPTDVTKTVQNVVGSETLFRVGFVADLAMMLAFLMVGLRFREFLKFVDRRLANAMALFVFVGTAVNLANLGNHYSVVGWITNPDLLQSFGADRAYANALAAERLYRITYEIANVFFGLWLMPLAILLGRSKLVPFALALVVAIGSGAYLTNSFFVFVFPAWSAAVTSVASIPMALSEFAVALWLSIVGSKPKSPDRTGSVETPPA